VRGGSEEPDDGCVVGYDADQVGSSFVSQLFERGWWDLIFFKSAWGTPGVGTDVGFDVKEKVDDYWIAFPSGVGYWLRVDLGSD
jgi:hypothetical protein